MVYKNQISIRIHTGMAYVRADKKQYQNSCNKMMGAEDLTRHFDAFQPEL
jgi:hypothetical protein